MKAIEKAMRLAWVPVLCLSIWLVHESNHQLDRHEKKDQYTAFPDPTWAERLPSGVNLWRSGQPDLDSLEIFLKESRVKTVIRLNGGREGAVSIEKEKSLCNQMGVDFYYFNIEAKGDQLNQLALSRISELLRQGNALVHCLHGFHRAGAAVGYFLQAEGLTKTEIVGFNGWSELIENPGQYARYTRHIQ